MLKDIHATLLTGYVTVAHTQLLSDYMIDKREIYYFFFGKQLTCAHRII